MKATSVEQQALLDLAAIDLEISRANRRIAEIRQASQRDEAQAKLSLASEKLLIARHVADELSSEIARLEQDLQLVDTRIAQDKSRLASSSNPRDITGIQHELASLEKRKSNLEELELELLVRREGNAAEVAAAVAARTEAQSELDEIDGQLEAAGVKAVSGLALLAQQREKYVALISAEQHELYNKLVGKTVPVARLEGFTCGACNLALSGATVDEIRSTAKDELARCPECAAMLVTIS